MTQRQRDLPGDAREKQREEVRAWCLARYETRFGRPWPWPSQLRPLLLTRDDGPFPVPKLNVGFMELLRAEADLANALSRSTRLAEQALATLGPMHPRHAWAASVRDASLRLREERRRAPPDRSDRTVRVALAEEAVRSTWALGKPSRTGDVATVSLLCGVWPSVHATASPSEVLKEEGKRILLAIKRASARLKTAPPPSTRGAIAHPPDQMSDGKGQETESFRTWRRWMETVAQVLLIDLEPSDEVSLLLRWWTRDHRDLSRIAVMGYERATKDSLVTWRPLQTVGHLLATDEQRESAQGLLDDMTRRQLQELWRQVAHRLRELDHERRLNRREANNRPSK